MKHHDSMKDANRLMTLSVKQLSQWNLPATPINYAVAYEYIINKNAPLVSLLKRQLLTGKALDNFFMEELHRDHILGQSKFRDEIIADLDDVVSEVENNCFQSSQSVQILINKLDMNMSEIFSGEEERIKKAHSQLRLASKKFKTNQQELVEQLLESQEKTKKLSSELEDIRKEIYLDPVTSLYNRKAMTMHVDAWLKEDPDKTIAAIVISLDDFPHFSQRFGSLIGDVILSKVAKKISNYVDDSGLPIRSAGDEFLILLPDVKGSIAKEIADKIKQGVEKLRFVSVKSGIRFPQMTLSLGVSEMRVQEPFQTFIRRTRKTLALPTNKLQVQQ